MQKIKTLTIKNFITVFFLLISLLVFGQNTKIPTGLLTELLRAPEMAVITDPEPEFGWIFPVEGKSQTAYQILVSSSPEFLEEGKADLWNSGKTQSTTSQNISYRGKELQSNSSYWWIVKVWGENNFVSDYSEAQKFNTGNFNREEDWIGQSNWVKLDKNKWVAEDRQMATFHSLQPVSFEKSSKVSWFADFGKAAFATLEFEVTAKVDGELLTIFLGERKNSDLTVNKKPGVSNIGFFKYQTEIKQGTHTYQVKIPRHNAKYLYSQKLPPFYPEVLPFRYVEMKGTQNMEVSNITQKALFYYFDDEASAFTSPNEKLNKVWNLCRYTLKTTPFLGVYCDGNRERMPYEADSYIQQLGHYSVDREFSAARYTIEFLVYHASWPTEWQMHSVMMAREHYMHTGDKELLAEIYDDLKKKTLIDLADKDGLISTRTGKVTPEFLKSIHFSGNGFGDIVDWPAGTPEGKEQISMAGPTPEGERDGYVFTDYNTVVNAFHFYSLKCMSEIASALGKEEDADFFQSQSEKVRAAIMDKMFDEEKGIFVDGIGTDHSSLHANMFPLAFNLVPEKNIKTVAEFIKTKGMACSVYGAQYFLEALYNAGEALYALDLMTSESKRSWMNMLNVGSTMTTEAWDEYYKPNLTWNHAWGSAPGNIVPRRLIGIQPIDPGYKTFTVNPQPQGLENLEIKIPTIRGPIQFKLKSNDNLWEMYLSVPGNSEAYVFIPSEMNTLKVNGKMYTSVSRTSYHGLSRNLLRLKSGSYRISAKK